MLFSSSGNDGRDWALWIIGIGSIIAIQLTGILAVIRMERLAPKRRNPLLDGDRLELTRDAGARQFHLVIAMDRGRKPESAAAQKLEAWRILS
jgi:hypothetical protein